MSYVGGVTTIKENKTQKKEIKHLTHVYKSKLTQPLCTHVDMVSISNLQSRSSIQGPIPSHISLQFKVGSDSQKLVDNQKLVGL